MNAPFKPDAAARAAGPVRFSVDDYYRMGEVGILGPEARTELIEGEILEMAPIGSEHAAVVNRTTRRLIEQIERQLIVSVQGPLRLGDDCVPQPDVMVLKSRPDGYRTKLPEADDVLLLIEVAHTTLAFDRGRKLALYAKHAIAEVWIVNLVANVIECYADPAADEYRTRTTHDAGANLQARLLPGLEIPVTDILGSAF